MRLLSILLVGILLAPTALAEDRVLYVPNDEEQGPFTYVDQQGNRTYQFSLNTDFFNLTTNDSDNNSVWEAVIFAQIVETGEISGTNHYSINYNFNTTWNANLDVHYYKHSFGRWIVAYDFSIYNGSTLYQSCDSTDPPYAPHFWGGRVQAPNPWMKFAFALRDIHGTQPYTEISFGDEKLGDVTCHSGGIGGGIVVEGMQHLIEEPSVTLTTYDSELYSDKLIYKFDTQRNELAEQEDAISSSANNCRQDFIFFGFCDIVKMFQNAISFAFNGVQWVIDNTLGLIPYAGEAFQFLAYVLSIVGESFILLLNIFFITDSEHSLGAVFWMHVVWFATAGAATTTLTGNPVYIVLFPLAFVKYSGLALWHSFKFFFVTLPMWAYEKTIWLIQTIRG